MHILTPPASTMARSQFTFAPGDRPLDGITIERAIGDGGFGEVYQAVTDGGKRVALKWIRRNLEIELRGAAHCLNLKHPNLVALHDIRRDDAGRPWLVMEFVEGESLAEVLDRNPHGLPEEEIRFWLAGVVRGVAHLHAHGLVHRDLKPANLFNDAGVVKVGDYGLAKFITAAGRTQTESVGTVHYMAPEIGNGRYGRSIDIYALGVILHEMVTGRVPFDGESIQEIIMRHLTEQPPLEDLPQPYRAAVAGALEKDPHRRFDSVEQLETVLHDPTPIAPEMATEEEIRFLDDEGEGEELAMTEPAPDSAEGADRDEDWEALNRCGVGLTGPGGWLNGEPISGWLHARWQACEGSPLGKSLYLLAAALVIGTLLASGPLALLTGLVGGLYLAGFATYRWLVGSPICGDDPRSADRRWQAAREHYENQTLTEQLFDLGSTLAVSAGVVVAGTAAFLTLSGYVFAGVATWLPLGGWIAGVATLGCWLVVLMDHLWRTEEAEFTLARRFAMALAGLLIGFAAWGLGDLLLASGSANETLAGWSSTPVALGGLLLSFALQMFLIRWWRFADPLRSVRFDVWGVLSTLLVTAIVQVVWPTAGMWSVLIAGLMAVGLQLGSPRYHAESRKTILPAPTSAPGC